MGLGTPARLLKIGQTNHSVEANINHRCEDRWLVTFRQQCKHDLSRRARQECAASSALSGCRGAGPMNVATAEHCFISPDRERPTSMSALNNFLLIITSASNGMWAKTTALTTSFTIILAFFRKSFDHESKAYSILTYRVDRGHLAGY
jgi:hypothetical protein